MTERTQHDATGPGTPDPEKVHTFDLIDEVPGVSDGAVTADPTDGDGEAGARDGDDPVEEHAPRRPGRVVRALAGARSALGRTARRGVAAVRRRLPGTRRGRVLLASGTAAVVVLAVAAGVLVDVQLRHRALLATPGGVRSLAEKPAEQWSIDLDDPIAATLVRMPGVLAVVGDGEVRGVDPGSGDVRWTVDAGGGPRCGPRPGLGTDGPGAVAPADPLVCVGSSRTGEQQVTVIDPDGTVQTREIGSDAVAVPAAGGGLVLFELTGGDQERRPLVVDKLGVPHLPKGFAGPDLVVRSEDAASGAERWSETVPFDAPRPESCVSYDQNQPVLDVAAALRWDVRDALVEVQGCGVSAAFVGDGTRLDDPADATDPPAGGMDVASFAPLPDGGWVAPGTAPTESGALHDVVHLPDGGSVALDGQVLVPWASDGRDPGLLLERTGPQTVGRSTDEGDAGARLWSAPRLAATALLARVSGTAVVVDEEGAVRAVDLGTGADRWTLDPEVLSLDGMAWVPESLIFGAYTDGDTLLLPVSAGREGDPSGLRLLAVDLHDGSVRWEIEQETPYTQLVSVDGYLAQITQQGVVGLG